MLLTHHIKGIISGRLESAAVTDVAALQTVYLAHGARLLLVLHRHARLVPLPRLLLLLRLHFLLLRWLLPRHAPLLLLLAPLWRRHLLLWLHAGLRHVACEEFLLVLLIHGSCE